jgi:hypothetical protein
MTTPVIFPRTVRLSKNQSITPSSPGSKKNPTTSSQNIRQQAQKIALFNCLIKTNQIK